MKFLTLIFILFIPLLGYAQTLKGLLQSAVKNNDIVQSKIYQQRAKNKELDAKKSSYYPTLDIGGIYKRDDAASPFNAGDTYNAYAKLSLELYDGGRRYAQIHEQKSSFTASKFDKEAYKKSLALQIVDDFFTIKDLQASLNAKQEAKKTLQAQLERTKSFYDAKMATLDDVQRVQADFDTNVYDIQTIKFQILSLKSLLELKVGKKITTLTKASFRKTFSTQYQTLDATRASIAQKDALNFSANAVESHYYPNLTLQDKYNGYIFERLDPKLTQLDAKPLTQQNTLLLSLNIRLFDFGQLREEKEALQLNAQALQSQITYQNKEQKIQLKLAKAHIRTAKLKIKSARSALDASQSAFITIEKKYNAGIVDYIVYLDALTKKTHAKALYASSLNGLELAYANYYYYSGKNLQEELE